MNEKFNAKQVAAKWPELHAWFLAGKSNWARQMMDNLRQYNCLSQKQIDVSLRIKGEESQPKPAPLAQEEKPALDVSAIEAAFNRAHSQGIKRPRMGFASLIFSRAPDNGANAGSIYIKSRGADGEAGVYLGKVFDGKMTTSRDCTPTQIEEIQKVLADPKRAAQAYGQEFGICCICSRLLTDETSIAMGIGPICAERFGFF